MKRTNNGATMYKSSKKSSPSRKWLTTQLMVGAVLASFGSTAHAQTTCDPSLGEIKQTVDFSSGTTWTGTGATRSTTLPASGTTPAGKTITTSVDFAANITSPVYWSKSLTEINNKNYLDLSQYYWLNSNFVYPKTTLNMSFANSHYPQINNLSVNANDVDVSTWTDFIEYNGTNIKADVNCSSFPNIGVASCTKVLDYSSTLRSTASLIYSSSNSLATNGDDDQSIAIDNIQFCALVPVLDIQKSDGGKDFISAQAGVYTLTISNKSKYVTTSGDLTITDTLPTGMTITSVSGANASFSGNTITIPDPNIAPGSSITVTVNVKAPTVTDITTVTNKVTVTGGGAPDPATGTDTTQIVPSAPQPPFPITTDLTCGTGETLYTIADNVSDTATTKQLIWSNPGEYGPQTYTFGTGSTAFTVTLQFTNMNNDSLGYPTVETGIQTNRASLVSDHSAGATYGTTLSQLNITTSIPTGASSVDVWDVDYRPRSLYSSDNFRDQLIASGTASVTGGSKVLISGQTATGNDNCETDDTGCNVDITWAGTAAGATHSVIYKAVQETTYLTTATHQAIGYNNIQICAVPPQPKNPNYTVTKDVDKATISAPGTLTYTITLTNTGDTPITGVVPTDTLSNGATVTLGTPTGDSNNNQQLDVGEKWVYTATYNVTQADIDATTTLNNVVSVTTNEVTTPKTDDAVTTITQTPAHAIAKAASTITDNDGDGLKGEAGDVITYSVVMTNTGNVTLSNVVVSDPKITPNTTTCTTVAPGAICTLKGNHSVTQAEVDAAQVINTATATSTPPTGVTPPPPATTTLTTPVPQTGGLQLNKTAAAPVDVNGNGLTDAGDQISYTFTVTNTGNVTLAPVTVTDPKLGLSAAACVATLAPKETATCSTRPTYTVTQADVNRGYVENSAVATGKTPNGQSVTDVSDAGDNTAETPGGNGSTDGNPTNDPTITPIAPQPRLELFKVSTGVIDTNSNGVQGDAGDILTYSFSVKNTGNVTLAPVTVTDAKLGLTAAACVASLAPQELAICSTTGRYTITQADADAGQITNTATAKGLTPAGTPTEDTSDDSNAPEKPGQDDPTVVTLPVPGGLQLYKTGAAPVDVNGNGLTDAGDQITYTFTVTNTGGVTLAPVTISDPKLGLNAAACVATLAPGETATCSTKPVYTIVQNDMNRGYVENSATATAKTPSGQAITDVSDAGNDTAETPGGSGGTDGNPANDPTVTLLTQTPRIALDKAISVVTDGNGNGLTDAGDQITYTFTVTNTGNVTLAPVTISDPKLGLSAVACVATLAPGETATCSTQGHYTITPADMTAGSVENVATVRGENPQDPSHPATATSNDPATTEPNDPTIYTIPQQPSLSLHKAQSTNLVVVKTDPTSGKITSYTPNTVTYTLTVTNTGNVAIVDALVTDSLPKGMAYQSHSATTPVTFTQAGQQLQFVTSLQAGQQNTIEVVARLEGLEADTVQNGIRNTATAQVPNSTIPPVTSTVLLDVDYPKLSKKVRNITKGGAWDVQNTADSGDQLEYCIVAHNYGSIVLSRFQIADSIPAHTLYVPNSATISSGTVKFENGTVQGEIPSLPVGGQAEMCFKVTVQ